MDRLLTKALVFAAHKHRDQRRKDIEASPYINHPIAVMSILHLEGGIDDTDTLVAAILHDTLEDTETTYEELVNNFGVKIADIVVELTDDQSIERIERYVQQAQKASRYSPEAKLIRIADKIANARDAIASPPPKWSPERLQGHLQQSVTIMGILRGTHRDLEDIFDALLKKKE